jgi:hypothetical protein
MAGTFFHKHIYRGRFTQSLGRGEMKRLFASLLISLILLSSFTALAPKAHAVDALVGSWKFDEGSGTVAVDGSGNGNNGTLYNAPAWVDGRRGTALNFDGTNQYAEITNNTDVNPHTRDWTVAAWVNIAGLRDGPDSSGFYGFIIVGKRQSPYQQGLTLLAHWGSSETSEAKFGFIFDQPHAIIGAVTPFMNVFGWHHVVGVRNGGNLTVYVDGVVYGPNNYAEGNSAPIDSDISSDDPLQIAHHGAWGIYDNGTIDEVTIYSRALSQQEIQSSMDPNDIIHYTDDFSVDSGLWTYCDNAYRDNIGKYVVLTDAVSFEAGGIWLNESLRSSFTVGFRYWVGNTTGTPTDGFVVKFFKQIDYSLPHGGYLGFSGLGYGIEFDTFKNDWDSSGNHIALIKDSYENHLARVGDGRICDNAWHNVTITVASSSITVDLDSERILSWNGTLDRTYGGFGFSAGTGDAYGFNDKHVIDDFSIDSPASQYEISITPATVSTSIGGTTHYTVTVDNQGGITDLFNLSVSGLNSTWVDLSKNSTYLIAGETAEIDLTISVPEDPSAVGAYVLCVFAKENLGVEKNASSQLTVFLNPIITDLEPENNTTISSTDALFSWCTSSNASSEVYIKQAGDLTFNNIVSGPGESHYISASNLTRNADYLWYAYSETANGNASSDVRALHVSNGICFAQRNYTFNIQRDYAQYASVSVTNNDTQPHDLLLEVLNPYQDLIVGFVGPGSVDENLTITSRETRSVAFNIFAQDAMQRNYTFTIKLTNLGPEQITDYALVYVNVRQPNVDLTLVEESTDPLMLSKTITATNYGDPITDLLIDISDELVGKVSFEPTVCHANLQTGGSLTFQAVPVLTADFAGFQGLALAISAGRIIASLQMNFTLPPGKSIYSVTIPRVSIEFSNYYDTDDSPNTNPLPGQMVESYLANGTIVFASQIIVDVYQNNTPGYGASVSLTVWNETGPVVEYCDTDTTGKALFNVAGLAGNYSYQAELVGYGIKTETRSFSVDNNPLFEIHPREITWLSASDGNTTYDLSGNLTNVTLDQTPFTFRGERSEVEENTTIRLVLRWDHDVHKKIYVPGSIQNNTLVFQTSCIPMGNFTAFIAYYSPDSGLSVSDSISIANKDPASMYTQGNYTYYSPFPFNSTHFIRLVNEHYAISRDLEVSFDLANIEPTGSNSAYLLRYVIISNEYAQKDFHICVNTVDGQLYNETFSLTLEPMKLAEVNFTIPVALLNGSLLPEFNSTLSMGSSSVLINTKCGLEYIFDTRIWVGSQDGVSNSVVYNGVLSKSLLLCGAAIVTLPLLPPVGTFMDGYDFVTGGDNVKGIIIIKYSVASAAGVACGLGSGPAAPAAAYACFTLSVAAGDIAQCLGNWQNVKAQEGSTGIGQSEVFSTRSWYCTNTPMFTTTFAISSCVCRTASPELNVDPAALIVHFTLPWPKGTYRNHQIHLLINNIEIGNLTDTIPEGNYIFPFNASILNYASEGTAQNTVTLRMENLNSGHYIVSTDMEIVLHLKKLILAVVSSNQTEADRIVEQLSGTVASLPDFGTYPENIACLNPQPKEGQSLTIEATIFNFGTVGMVNVPVDLYIDSVNVNSAIIGFLPAFANQTVNFSWIATRGTHNIAIVVNGIQQILEYDYGNNQAQTSITIFTDDVAVDNVASAKTVVGQGFSFNVSVTVANGGELTETFNVTAYANATIIASQNVTLSTTGFATITLTWNTTGIAYGNYTISAYAQPVIGETNIADNNFTGGWVIVSLVGDITGPDGWPDGKCDMRDIGYVARRFMCKPGDPLWDPNADIDDNSKVDMKDIGTVARHFGETSP